MRPSRRYLLRLSGLTGGTLLLQACSVPPPAPPAAAIGAFDKYGVTVSVQYIETATAVAAMDE